MRHIALALLLLFSGSGVSASDHRCADDARERARKLLALHVDLAGMEDRVGFEGPFVAPSIRNPSAPRQRFEVLEVIGYISPHGEYRMRFIYYMMPRDCLLMGQEILERAKL
jgi:hypothetical protein